MSKKFLSLGLLLAGALTVTGLAASGAISLPFMAVTAKTAVGTVEPTSTNPAQNAEVPSSDGLSVVTFTYPGVGVGEYTVIHINRAAGDIVVKKDGAVYQTIKASDETNVYANTSYPNVLRVNVNALKQAGTYTVELPDNLVDEAQGGETFGEDGTSTAEAGASAPYTLTFKVIEKFDYSVYPAAGGQAMISALANVTITYPAGTTVKINNTASKASLEQVNLADSELNKQLTEYEATANGNVVTLTAINPDGIVALTGNILTNYAEIRVPAGLYTVSGSGRSEVVSKLTFGPYQPAAFAASSLVVSPANNGTEVANTDLAAIQITFPEAVTKGGASTAGYLYYTGDADGAQASGSMFFAYKFDSLSEDGKTVTIVPTLPALASNTYKGDLSKFESGHYRLQLYANLVVDAKGNKSTAMYLNPFNVKGAQGQCANYFKVGTAGNNVNAVAASTGFDNVSLGYTIKVKANPDCKDQIFLYKDDKVLKGINVKDLAVANTSSTTVKIDFGQKYTEAGKYRVVVPANAFIQDQYATNPTVAEEITFYLAEVADVTTTPESYDTKDLAKANDTDPDKYDEYSFDEIVVRYPEGYTLSGDADASKITLASGGLGSSNGPVVTSVELYGNMAILSVENPPMATNTSGYTLTVGAGAFDVTDTNGNTAPNLEVKRFFFPHYILKGNVTPANNAWLENANELQTIAYYGYQAVYANDAAGYLYKVAPAAGGDDDWGVFAGRAAKELVATYTATFKANGDGDLKAVSFTTDTDLTNVEGDLEFVIAENSFRSNSTANASSYYNPEFTYRFFVQPILENYVSYIQPEESDEDNPVNPAMTMSGNGLNMIMFGLDPSERLNGDINQNPACQESVELVYLGADGWDYEVVASVPTVPGEDGLGLMANGWGALQVMAIFDTATQQAVPAKFSKPGCYMLNVPDGAFTVTAEGEVTELKGFQLFYWLGEATGVDFTYVLDPAPTADSTDENGEATLTALDKITITFPNSVAVSYPDASNPNCKPMSYIETLDGLKIESGKYPAIDGNALTYSFKAPEGGWQTGWYQFTIPANSIYVDYNSWVTDEYEDLGNFQGLSTLYYLGKPDNTSGVAIFGLGVADSYQIYTVDGKAVKLNAVMDDLRDLENGIYVINGKKVLVRK